MKGTKRGMRWSSKLLLMVWILMSLVFIFAIVTTWRSDINISINYVPTVLNGLVSGTTFTVGFTGAIIALMLKDYIKKKSIYLNVLVLFTLVAMLLPIALISRCYYYLLVRSNYTQAIREILTGLLFSAFVLFSVLLIVVGVKFEEMVM